MCARHARTGGKAGLSEGRERGRAKRCCIPQLTCAHAPTTTATTIIELLKSNVTTTKRDSCTHTHTERDTHTHLQLNPGRTNAVNAGVVATHVSSLFYSRQKRATTITTRGCNSVSAMCQCVCVCQCMCACVSELLCQC